MKFFICIIAVILLGVTIEAFPQRARFQKLPYYPPPRRPSRPIRVRRDTNQEVKVNVQSNVGPNKLSSASLGYDINGHGIEITKAHVPNAIDTLKATANANIFSSPSNSLDAKLYASKNELANGFKFERNGGGLEWNNVNGHSASAMLGHIPNVGNQLDLGGKINLFKDQNSRFDITGGASRWLDGPLSGKTDYNTGFNWGYTFG